MNAGSSSFINFLKDSDCVTCNGRESKIIQFTNKLQSSTCHVSLWGLICESWDGGG